LFKKIISNIDEIRGKKYQFKELAKQNSTNNDK